MTDLKDFHDNLDRMNAAQSKANMQNNIDSFATEFLNWLKKSGFLTDFIRGLKSSKELLQKFKEQNGK